MLYNPAGIHWNYVLTSFQTLKGHLEVNCGQWTTCVLFGFSFTKSALFFDFSICVKVTFCKTKAKGQNQQEAFFLFPSLSYLLILRFTHSLSVTHPETNSSSFLSVVSPFIPWHPDSSKGVSPIYQIFPSIHQGFNICQSLWEIPYLHYLNKILQKSQESVSHLQMRKSRSREDKLLKDLEPHSYLILCLDGRLSQSP